MGLLSVIAVLVVVYPIPLVVLIWPPFLLCLLLFVAVVLFLAQHFIVVAVAVAVVVFTVGLHLFALI